MSDRRLFDAARVVAASSLSAPPPAHQPLLWPMLPSLSSMEQMHRLERRRPSRFAVVNQDAAFAAMPTPVLHVAEPGFAPDLLWAGLHFASARLRDALDLGPDAVEYGDVDTTGSTAAARAADYKVFRVVHGADPIDLARIYGHEPDRETESSPTTAWLLSIAGPHAKPRRTIWREGFIPPAPLFRDRDGRLIATESLADRVTRTGVTDVVFQDLVSEAALHGLVFRSGPPTHVQAPGAR